MTPFKGAISSYISGFQGKRHKYQILKFGAALTTAAVRIGHGIPPVTEFFRRPIRAHFYYNSFPGVCTDSDRMKITGDN
jgi:hypothetical protein